MLLKIVTEFEPAAVVVAWDAREKTFRHEEFEAYKAQRPPMPDLLSQQWAHLPGAGGRLRLSQPVKPGFEADDILGTLAEEAKRQGAARSSSPATATRCSSSTTTSGSWPPAAA